MRSTLRLMLPTGVTDAQVRRLCAALEEQLAAGAVGTVVCAVDPSSGDLATVDAVARVALVARRADVAFCLDGPGAELVSLLGLVGLGTALVGGPAAPR